MGVVGAHLFSIFVLSCYVYLRSESEILLIMALNTITLILNNEERPECVPCYCNYSLKLILIHSVIADVRQTFYDDMLS
jgi:hypothetical protein